MKIKIGACDSRDNFKFFLKKTSIKTLQVSLLLLKKILNTLSKKLQRKEKEEKERDYRYTAVIRSLVWRYVCHQHKMADESPVTEDDINEVKGEVSAMKYDILEVLGKNGMDTSSVAAKDKGELNILRQILL